MQEQERAAARQDASRLKKEFAQRQAQALRNKAAAEADGRVQAAIYIPNHPAPPQQHANHPFAAGVHYPDPGIVARRILAPCLEGVPSATPPDPVYGQCRDAVAPVAERAPSGLPLVSHADASSPMHGDRPPLRAPHSGQGMPVPRSSRFAVQPCRDDAISLAER